MSTDAPRPERVARAFHEAYERLAPQFGYGTREASAVPWDDVPDANKRLMIATAAAVLADREIARGLALIEAVDMIAHAGFDESSKSGDAWAQRTCRDLLAAIGIDEPTVPAAADPLHVVSGQIHNCRRCDSRGMCPTHEAAYYEAARALSRPGVPTEDADAPTAPPKPPDIEASPCDWGSCDAEGFTWRWAPDLNYWLPVCEEHAADAPSEISREDSPSRLHTSAAPTTGVPTEDDDGMWRCKDMEPHEPHVLANAVQSCCAGRVPTEDGPQ